LDVCGACFAGDRRAKPAYVSGETHVTESHGSKKGPGLETLFLEFNLALHDGANLWRINVRLNQCRTIIRASGSGNAKKEMAGLQSVLRGRERLSSVSSTLLFSHRRHKATWLAGAQAAESLRLKLEKLPLCDLSVLLVLCRIACTIRVPAVHKDVICSGRISGLSRQEKQQQQAEIIHGYLVILLPFLS